MQTGYGKQEVVWQYPDPATDVYRGQKGSNAGEQVEVGQYVVEDLGEPDLARHEFARIARNLLSITEVCRFFDGIAVHHIDTRSLR